MSQATSQTLGPESPYKLQDWGCVIPTKATLLCLYRALDMRDGYIFEGSLDAALLSTGHHGSF